MSAVFTQKKNAILLTFDKNYVDYAVACLSSIVSNFPNYPDVFISFEGAEHEGLERVLCFPRTRRIVFENEDSIIEGLDLGPLSSKAAFMRIFAWSSVFKDYDKVLYLDVDCLVLGSLDHLFEKDDFYMVKDLTIDPSSEFWIFKPGNAHNRELRDLLKEDGLAYEDVHYKMSNAGMFIIPKRFRTEANSKMLWRIARRYGEFLMLGDQSIISIWCTIHNIQGKKEYENNLQTTGLFYFSMELPIKKLKKKNGIKIVHFNAIKPHTDILERFRSNYMVYDQSYKKYQYYLNMFSKTNKRREQLDTSDVSMLWVINSDEEKECLKERKYLLSYIENTYIGYELIILEYGVEPKFQDTLGTRNNVRYHYIHSDRNFSMPALVHFGVNTASHTKVLVCNGISVPHPKAILKATQLLNKYHPLIVLHDDIVFQIEYKVFKKHRGNIGFFPEVHTEKNIDWSQYALLDPSHAIISNTRDSCFFVDRIQANIITPFDTKAEHLKEMLTEVMEQQHNTIQLSYGLYSFQQHTAE